MNLQTLIPLALKVSVLLTVFAIGLKASLRDATYLFRRPRELACAILAMNVVMPLVAAGLIAVFDLSVPVRIALVSLSLSPIPPLLPKKLVKGGGTASYAGGLLIAAGLLAIIFVPLALEVIERVIDFPLQMTAASIAQLILLTMLLPIGAGVAVHSVVPTVAARIAKPISRIAGVVLLACVGAILWVAAPAMWKLAGNGTLAAMAVFVLVAVAAGYLLGGPDRDNRASLAIATSSRHPGIAIAIAQANFPEQKLAMAAVLLYLVVNGIVSFAFGRWAGRRQPAD